MRWSVINKVAAFLMAGFLVFILVKKHVIDKDKLSANHRFTIATLYKISYPADSGPDADFEYCVNNKNYKHFSNFNPDGQTVSAGDRFLLKHLPQDPAVFQILFDKQFDNTSKPEVVIDTCQVIPK